jgi:hypothetical protein
MERKIQVHERTLFRAARSGSIVGHGGVVAGALPIIPQTPKVVKAREAGIINAGRIR